MNIAARTHRLDALEVGQIASLRFHKHLIEDVEQVVFMGIVGEGDDRVAEFISCNSDGQMYRWVAYRLNGHWAYGTTGDRFSVIAVK